MGKNVIYVLHEYGANSHYNALVVLAKQKNYEVKFYEFSLYTLLKCTLKGKYRISKWIANIFFLLRISFIKPTKIVIGIAPFNPMLKVMMFLLKKHEVYYHTSYTHWDGKMAAYPVQSEINLERWKYFTTKYVKHIFAVSQKTKDEIVSNGYATPDKISIVNHSYNIPIYASHHHFKDNTFIFVGRLEGIKGIDEILTIFSKKPYANLTIIGSGSKEDIVKEYVKTYKNITYKGYVKGLKNLIPLYSKASFLIMNSHKTNSWEELFGIAIIEGMACGCVPIATDHPGPKEIITSDINGIICKEGEIEKGIEKAIAMSNDNYQKMRILSIQCGQNYSSKKMAQRWQNIFT